MPDDRWFGLALVWMWATWIGLPGAQQPAHDSPPETASWVSADRRWVFDVRAVEGEVPGTPWLTLTFDGTRRWARATREVLAHYAVSSDGFVAGMGRVEAGDGARLLRYDVLDPGGESVWTLERPDPSRDALWAAERGRWVAVQSTLERAVFSPVSGGRWEVISLIDGQPVATVNPVSGERFEGRLCWSGPPTEIVGTPLLVAHWMVVGAERADAYVCVLDADFAVVWERYAPGVYGDARSEEPSAERDLDAVADFVASGASIVAEGERTFRLQLAPGGPAEVFEVSPTPEGWVVRSAAPSDLPKDR